MSGVSYFTEEIWSSYLKVSLSLRVRRAVGFEVTAQTQLECA
jgi:hypothetical protein